MGAFLTRDDFDSYVGADNARVVLGNTPDAWQRRLKAASTFITDRTGVNPPDDDTAAPDWASEACAYVILHRSVGNNATVDREFRLWAADMYRIALDLIEQNRMKQPAGRKQSGLGCIEGMASW